MTDPDTRLRSLLEQAAPDAPGLDPTSRAAAVVRRGRAARRRDRGLVAGAAAAVLALAVGVPLALVDDDAGPAEVASRTTSTAARCPVDPVDISGKTSVDDLSGVVSARLCDPVGTDPDSMDRLPVNPLVGEALAAFVEDVTALPDHRLPEVCSITDARQEPWALMLETADGDTSVIGGTSRTCSAVDVEGNKRGAADVLAVFRGNLQRQGDGAMTPGAAGPSCPDAEWLSEGADTWNTSFDLETATAGVLCARADWMEDPVYVDDEGALDPEAFTTIRDDLADRVRPEPAEIGTCGTGSGPARLLVLTNDAGDRVAYLDERCIGIFVGPQGHWQPSAAAEAAITEALGGLYRAR